MKIKIAMRQDLKSLAGLALLLWPKHTLSELKEEFQVLIQSSKAVVFLASEGAQDVAFAQCKLREDYVEGTSSSPVAYLEGIFVREEYRGQGIAKILLSECESWGRKQGCREFASDCELTNQESLLFHQRMGFDEKNRIICFAKEL